MSDAARSFKETAVRFLHLVIAGRIEEAYEKYVDMSGKHHNPYFPAGFPALKQAMIENHAQFPDKRIDIKHVIAEGDLVSAHSRVVLGPGEKDIAVVHVFRFRGEKIVELWDIGQPVPGDSPNRDGAF